MCQLPLDTLRVLASRFAAQLDCTQDVVCQNIMHMIAETGHPLSPVSLARRLRMSQGDLVSYLAHIPDVEFDEHGNIVGWGFSLLPTPHQILLSEHPLYTWCAFDTVLFPPLLHTVARVHSICSVTGYPITFVAAPEGIRDLQPTTCVLSCMLPAQRGDCVRGNFCRDSLFFWSEQAAAPWLLEHPEAILISIEEAALVGMLVTNPRRN